MAFLIPYNLPSGPGHDAALHHPPRLRPRPHPIAVPSPRLPGCCRIAASVRKTSTAHIPALSPVLASVLVYGALSSETQYRQWQRILAVWRTSGGVYTTPRYTLPRHSKVSSSVRCSCPPPQGRTLSTTTEICSYIVGPYCYDYYYYYYHHDVTDRLSC